ncbi:MAG: hypothetical protein GSR80_000121 [Desulfurococcales archaeon]|nr:hypothetical protein [Desulfurococcales archaeon]
MAARGRRRARRAIAPVIIAVIIAAIVAGGATAAYVLSRPASEAPLTPAGSDYILSSVTVTYVARSSLGIGGEYYEVQVHLNQSLVGSGPVDVYILVPTGDGYDVVTSETDVRDGGVVKAPVLDSSKPLYVLAAWRAPQYMGVMVDAIIVMNPPRYPGRIVESATHSWEDGVPQEYRIHPNFLAQYVKVKVSWWDLIWEQWRGAWGLATALRFTGSLVVEMLPYAGVLWLLWFFSAAARALAEFTAEPIVDFFYKNYQIIRGIYSLVLNVVLKLVDILTGPAS